MLDSPFYVQHRPGEFHASTMSLSESSTMSTSVSKPEVETDNQGDSSMMLHARLQQQQQINNNAAVELDKAEESQRLVGELIGCLMMPSPESNRKRPLPKQEYHSNHDRKDEHIEPKQLNKRQRLSTNNTDPSARNNCPLSPATQKLLVEVPYSPPELSSPMLLRRRVLSDPNLDLGDDHRHSLLFSTGTATTLRAKSDEQRYARFRPKPTNFAQRLRRVELSQTPRLTRRFSQDKRVPGEKPWRIPLIPAEHPRKILWDCLTVLLSFANIYATHVSIRDRQFVGYNITSLFRLLCGAWFVVDIVLNFFTEHKLAGKLLTDPKAVWARYLTTWFAVDVLSLLPGEILYVQPIIDIANNRGPLQKTVFRTKAVTKFLLKQFRLGHVRLFNRALEQRRITGLGFSRLLRVVIKYLPKYIMFLRNMKGVVVLRCLRQVHWWRKFWVNFIWRRNEKEMHKNDPQTFQEDDETESLTEDQNSYDEDSDDGFHGVVAETDDDGEGVELLYGSSLKFVDNEPNRTIVDDIDDTSVLYDDGDPF